MTIYFSAACEWPADSDEIAYKYSDSSANGDKMMAGINHVEVIIN